jgi:hypothetical protein
MPLEAGSSKEAISKNIATEREHGKPENQAIAIAMRTAGKPKPGGDAVLSYGGGYSAVFTPGGEGDTSSPSANHGTEVSRLGGKSTSSLGDTGEFGRDAAQYLGKPVTPHPMRDWSPENEGASRSDEHGADEKIDPNYHETDISEEGYCTECGKESPNIKMVNGEQLCSECRAKLAKKRK